MKRAWTPDELEAHWTLRLDERALLSNKTGATRLGFAVLLKAFALEGRFPQRTIDVPAVVVEHLARQVGVAKRAFLEFDWDGRSIKTYRVQIRTRFGWRETTVKDARDLTDWLSRSVTNLDAEGEVFKTLALERLRALKLEPPSPPRLGRILASAVRFYEARLFATVLERLSPVMRDALDELVSTDTEDAQTDGQASLFAERSDFAHLKGDPGAVGVHSVLEEIGKLERLHALNLPPKLFEGVPSRIVEHYRKRVATERPRHVRRHLDGVRYTLLAAFCQCRASEVTDNLVELLTLIAHRINARAETRVETEILENLRKVSGKANLLFSLAETALGHPDGVVKDVLFPVVGEQTLKALVEEHKTSGPAYKQRVKTVMRASYGHH